MFRGGSPRFRSPALFALGILDFSLFKYPNMYLSHFKRYLEILNKEIYAVVFTDATQRTFDRERPSPLIVPERAIRAQPTAVRCVVQCNVSLSLSPSFSLYTADKIDSPFPSRSIPFRSVSRRQHCRTTAIIRTARYTFLLFVRVERVE